MKVSTTTLILGVSLAVVAGLFGTTIFGVADLHNTALTSASASGVITGHVTTTLTDSAGNIKEYRQSDNQIVNTGETCVTKVLFAVSPSTVTTGPCGAAFTSGFRFIGIGNYSTAANGTQTALGNEYQLSMPSLARSGSVAVMTNSTGLDQTAGSFGKAVISKTFTCTHCVNPQIVTESGLFNSTNVHADPMFARQQFSAITMNNGDSLTVQWTVNVGGAAALSP